MVAVIINADKTSKPLLEIGGGYTEPTADNHTAPKKYVDDEKNKINRKTVVSGDADVEVGDQYISLSDPTGVFNLPDIDVDRRMVLRNNTGIKIDVNVDVSDTFEGDPTGARIDKGSIWAIVSDSANNNWELESIT